MKVFFLTFLFVFGIGAFVFVGLMVLRWGENMIDKYIFGEKKSRKPLI